MRIPIRNLYYLLCYAWDSLGSTDLVDVGSLEGSDARELLARMLHEGISRAIRRGLERDYVTLTADLRGVRGKIDLAETAKRFLSRRGELCCRFDEMTAAAPLNIVIKAAARELASCRAVDDALRIRLKDLVALLHEVPDRPLTRDLIQRVVLHRNNAHHRFLLHVCRLIHACLMPDSAAGGERLRDFAGDDQQMGKLFESFVRNFLAREQKTFQVGSRKFRWSTESAPVGDCALPEMKTDISLTRDDREAVVETKFVGDPFPARFGRPTVRSDHLYQLFAYLRNSRRGRGEQAPVPLGVLLYASTGIMRSLTTTIDGHPVWVRALDLDRPWPEIRGALLGLAEEIRGSTQSG